MTAALASTTITTCLQRSPRFSLRQRSSSRFQHRHATNQRRPRSNEQITAKEVLLILDGQPPVKLSREDALARAKSEELDLIEVSPKAVPPVVKIGDYGSHLYQLQKKAKRQKAHSKQAGVKTIRIGFRTDVGDVERQASRAREFLAENHMVKAGIILRGRENTNKQYAIDKLKRFVASLSDVSDVEQDVRKQGNQFIIIVKPKKWIVRAEQ